MLKTRESPYKTVLLNEFLLEIPNGLRDTCHESYAVHVLFCSVPPCHVSGHPRTFISRKERKRFRGLAPEDGK